MKMEPIVSSETSAIKSQTPGNYPKRNKLHLQHGESLRTTYLKDQMKDLKHVGKMPFGRYKEHKHEQLEESST